MKTTYNNTTGNKAKSLPLNPSTLTCRYLTPEDMTGIIRLQDTIYETLKARKTPRHIVYRGKEYFRKHLLAPNAMFGIIDSQEGIIAQTIFRVSDVSTKEELCVDTLPGLGKNDRVSVAQGVLVHPDYQGAGLMQLMLWKWYQWCEEQDIRHLTARTEITQEASYKAFTHNDFNVVATIIDPKDSAEVRVLHKILEISPSAPARGNPTEGPPDPDSRSCLFPERAAHPAL